jgi:hypothetical protein
MPARPTHTLITICRFLSRSEQQDQKHEDEFFTRAGISGISVWVRLSLSRNKNQLLDTGNESCFNLPVEFF